MTELIREEQYIFIAGAKKYAFRVQELVWGSSAWPERFRIDVPESSTCDGKTFYGITAHEAIEQAIEYLSSPAFEAGLSRSDVHVSDRILSFGSPVSL